MLIQWELSNHNCNIDFYAKWQMKGLEFRWQLKITKQKYTEPALKAKLTGQNSLSS